ncbi:MAG TPA: beta-N-acetylhexosaminidase [Caulobacteraceae bacterium]
MTHACILGLSGLMPTAEEEAFFRDTQPWGFILFRRNVESPGQLRSLTTALRKLVDRADAPILIDQEGGRVQRLGPPHWPSYPPARAFQAVEDRYARRELVRLSARLMALDLSAVGIDVDCVPVVDVPAPGAHGIIGDRAYADEPTEVGRLARAAAEGLMAGGVLPVVKHIPGHGRAGADSHEALPVVNAGLDELDRIDFEAFRRVSDMPMAMTAHVVFQAIDPQRPATTSPEVVSRVVRQRIGFDGLLISDDLSMKALSGSLRDRARAALDAGCDVVLHCNGDLQEMRETVAGCRALAGRAAERARSALARRPASPEPVDGAQARAALSAALKVGAA